MKFSIVAVLALLSGTEAVKIQSKEQIDQAVQDYLEADEGSEAEWGFLKNIVNIDKFFDSGVKAWSNGKKAIKKIFKLVQENIFFKL